MMNIKNFNHFIVLCLLSLHLLWGCNSTTDAPYLVGAAQENITPLGAAFIAGGSINRQFEGIHDSLYVKTVVVTTGENSLALISLDCIGLLYPDLLRIRKEVSQRLAGTFFEPKHIVMTSTHTHSGPDVVGIWGPDRMTSGVDEEYLEWLIMQSAQAIEKAWKNRQQATARYAISEFGNDWVQNISDPATIDRSLKVLQFLDNDEQSIATLVNFACHPTILNGYRNLVSADFPAGMYHWLDNRLGGVNVYLQGAIGGWVQPVFETRSFDLAWQRGQELGEAVEMALEYSFALENTELGFLSEVIRIPVSNPGFRQLSSLGVFSREFSDSVETEIAWFRIGEATFATHPGESTPAHSLATKELMSTKGPKFIIGLGMDALGYILSDDFLTEDSPHHHIDYMLSMSVDPQIGTIMMEMLERLAERDELLYPNDNQ